MTRLFLLGLAAALAIAQAAAQTPDTTTASRYYPLAVGNEWHHLETGSTGGQAVTPVQTRHEVLGEPTPGRFRVQTTTSFAVPLPPPPTVTEATWRYDAATQSILGSGTPCPLGAPFGASAFCSATSTGYDITGGYDRIVAVGGDFVVTSTKMFVYSFSTGSAGGAVWTTFAAGIGPTRYGVNVTAPDAGGVILRTRTLRYARVGGVEFGSPIFVAGEETPEAAALGLSVGPNPASTAATVRYTLAAPETVRVTVFDVLGREVARPVDGARAAGPHTEALIVAGLPAGVYAVRLDAGGRTAVRRLSVVR